MYCMKQKQQVLQVKCHTSEVVVVVLEWAEHLLYFVNLLLADLVDKDILNFLLVYHIVVFVGYKTPVI